MKPRRKTKPLTVRIDAELYQQLADLMHIRNMSIREAVETAVGTYLETHIGPNEKHVLSTMRDARGEACEL